jgi:hypothetical protein
MEPEQPGPDPEFEDPRDLRGCLVFLARFTTCTTILWIIMAAAIVLVALLSLFFFRG